MTERDNPTFGVLVSDPELRAFMREQAGLFFGGKVSPYITSLIELDRRLGVTRTEILRRAGVVEPERVEELAAAS